MAVVGPKAGAESPVAVEVAAEAVPMAQAAVYDGLACRAWTLCPRQPVGFRKSFTGEIQYQYIPTPRPLSTAASMPSATLRSTSSTASRAAASVVAPASSSDAPIRAWMVVGRGRVLPLGCSIGVAHTMYGFTIHVPEVAGRDFRRDCTCFKDWKVS